MRALCCRLRVLHFGLHCLQDLSMYFVCITTILSSKRVFSPVAYLSNLELKWKEHATSTLAMPALFDRFSAVPGLIITSAICYTLLGLHVNSYRGPESLLIWTREHRTAVTVLVQLVSQVLGIIHVHVMCQCKQGQDCISEC
jgi:hypothetical protein